MKTLNVKTKCRNCGNIKSEKFYGDVDREANDQYWMGCFYGAFANAENHNVPFTVMRSCDCDAGSFIIHDVVSYKAT